MSRTTENALQLVRFNVTPEGSDNNIFRIKYSNGSLTIDLQQLLPCSDADFKRLTAFIDKIDLYADQERAVNFVYAYISGMYSELCRIKETYSEHDTKSPRECCELCAVYC